MCVRSVDETKVPLKFFSVAIIWSYSSRTQLSFLLNGANDLETPSNTANFTLPAPS